MFRNSPDGTITLNTCFLAHIIDFTFIKPSNKVIVVLLSLLLTFVQCASHFCILFMHNMPLHLPPFFQLPVCHTHSVKTLKLCSKTKQAAFCLHRHNN